MKLNKDFEICVRLYTYLNKDPVSCLELANDLNTSRNYLHKLTGILNRAGLLKITNGAKGGIALPDRTVTALDVYVTLNEKNEVASCKDSYFTIIVSILELLDETVLHKVKDD
jgi:DNA-binding IscR family transcriptional regulator